MNGKIIIKENPQPKFNVYEMLCDKPLTKRLEKYPSINEHLNKQNTTVIIGVQGQGKTTLLLNIVKNIYRKCFHDIIVVMPEQSRKSIKDNIFEKYLPPENLYNDLDIDVLNEIDGKIKANAQEDFNTLVIYDDVQNKLKNNTFKNIFNSFIANQRHMRVCNIILLQNYISLPKETRRLINNIFMFNLDKDQTEQIFKEHIKFKKELYNDICNECFKNHGDFIFLNTNTKKIYKKFDEIIIEDK